MRILVPIIAALTAALSVQAQSTFNGNGNGSFNGAIGNGSLVLSNNATTLFGKLTTGAGLSGNAFVLFIEAGGGGFSTTAGFTDTGDQLRKAISGLDGGSRSTLNFASGFAPNFAISLQPGAGINFGGLWSLVNAGSHAFQTSIGLTPTGSDAAGVYNFSLSLASLGLSAGQSLDLFGYQISTTGYSSAETIGGGLTGSIGYGNTQTQTSFSTYTITPVPEPTTMALAGSGLALLYVLRRRK